MAPLRRSEQIAAARCTGVTDVRFLGYPDGRVEATIGLRRDLARVIRQVRPDRVLCPSPERSYTRPGFSHPDHRAVGSSTLDAIYPDARNPGRKVAALRAHASQTGHMMDLEDRIRGRLTAAAATAGLPDGSLAEPFQVLNTA